VTAPDHFRIIDLADLTPHPANRKRLGDLSALAASIGAQGIIEPLIVREVRDGYEIICGERRWRAAVEAGLISAPCIVRDLDDDDALEMMVVENSQRHDAHPVEEAATFSALIESGYTASRIAERIGRPVSYVAQRLRLAEAHQSVRDALDADTITLGVALLIARQPQGQQEHLVALLRDVGGRVPTLAEARRLIEREQRPLSAATWKLSDAKLVRAAGACTKCPKRTGAQVDLFDDVTEDRCLDGDCWEGKRTAHLAQLAAKAPPPPPREEEDEDEADEEPRALETPPPSAPPSRLVAAEDAERRGHLERVTRRAAEIARGTIMVRVREAPDSEAVLRLLAAAQVHSTPEEVAGEHFDAGPEELRRLTAEWVQSADLRELMDHAVHHALSGFRSQQLTERFEDGGHCWEYALAAFDLDRKKLLATAEMKLRVDDKRAARLAAKGAAGG